MILGICYYLALLLLLLLTGTAPTRLSTVRETPKMMSYGVWQAELTIQDLVSESSAQRCQCWNF